MELAWTVEDGRNVIEDIEYVHPKKLVWDSTTDELKVCTREYPSGVELPENKFVVHKYKAKSGHASRAGIMRVVSWMYLFKNYAVIVPKDCFKTKSVMNDTNVTTGGYVGSKMYKTVLPVYAAALQTALNNHILSHRELLTTAVSTTGNSNAGAGITGYASNWEWKDCLVKLMSEIQVYGSTVLSSSFYDTGCDNIQFPLFRLAPNLKVAGLGHNGSRWWYWLSAVVSAAAFADCDNNGTSRSNNAAGDGGVRPYFCIG